MAKRQTRALTQFGILFVVAVTAAVVLGWRSVQVVDPPVTEAVTPAPATRLVTTSRDPLPPTASSANRSTVASPKAIGSTEPCAVHSDCVSCLTCLHRGGCVWCAATRQCIPHDAVATLAQCPDREARACPAVLHTRLPQTMRVIHVAIRKGGPEALVQMHLALNHWGFSTTLDTRRSKRQKGGAVVPFFTDMYAAEFAQAPLLRWEATYESWLESAAEGDVMIATETWTCRNDWRKTKLPQGARQMQWHLTVWPKKPRNDCTIAAHTNYIAQEYMLAPRRSLMFPYVSPHIVKLAQSRADVLRSSKKPIVMYDGDVQLRDEDLAPRPGTSPHYTVRKATGFTPQDLYDMYTKTSAGIDLNLPGAERFIYEASLFDVCVIVDNVSNGADKSDLPLPDRFRVKPNDKSALLGAIQECVSNYDMSIAAQAPLKAQTLAQRSRFLRHVRRYFSNSVHVVTYFSSAEEVDQLAASFVLHTLFALPFASVELLLAPGVTIPASVLQKLDAHSYLAAVTITSNAAPSSFGAWSSPKRTAYVILARPDVVLVSPDLVHGLSSVVVALEASIGGARQQQHSAALVALVKGQGYWFMSSRVAAMAAAAATGSDTCGAHFPCAAVDALLRQRSDRNVVVVGAESTTLESANPDVALLPERAWVGVRKLVAGLGPLTALSVGQPVALAKLLVEWGAQDEDGGESTVGMLQYYCSHPLYAATKGAAKCDWVPPQ